MEAGLAWVAHFELLVLVKHQVECGRAPDLHELLRGLVEGSDKVGAAVEQVPHLSLREVRMGLQHTEGSRQSEERWWQ